jgi:hypothetical protein
VTHGPASGIAHVAESGEGRGRIVLRMGAAEPHRIAIEAALRIARAFQAELESLFIEDQRLFDCAAAAVGNVVGFDGRPQPALSAATLLRQMTFMARRAEAQVATMARLADVPYRARTVRDEPLQAVSRACCDAGPWNIVALASPVTEHERESVVRILTDVEGATGIVMVGPGIATTQGPILAIVEDGERLMPLLRVAAQLATTPDEQIHILLVGETETELAALEARARLALAGRADVTYRTPAVAHRAPAVVAEVVRRSRPGFVVGHLGGNLLPADASWRHLSDAVSCPVLLVR